MRRLTLLLWNASWYRLAAGPVPGCPAGCKLTIDPDRFADADAVLFHLPNLGATPRHQKSREQQWVGVSLESDANYPHQADPDFMSQFDLTMTYRLDSDIPVPYVEYEHLEAMRTPVQDKVEPAPAVYFASNTNSLNGRDLFVSALMKTTAVDSFGRALRNRELIEDRGRETKLAMIARYRYTLAFENSIGTDYVTEKFFDPLIVGSVPVYLGAPNVEDFAPGDHCYINALDFGGPTGLGEYLAHLAATPEEYAAYHAWRQQPLRPSFVQLAESQREHPLRRLCARLAGH